MAELAPETPAFSLKEILSLTDDEIAQMGAQDVRLYLHAIGFYQTSNELAAITEKINAQIDNI